MNNKERRTQIILALVFIVICLSVFIPFLLLVSASFSNEKDVIVNGFKLIPEHFDLTAYKFVFRNSSDILQAYKITITYTLVAMILSTILTAFTAYPLSSPKMRCKTGFAFYLYFTMLFSGGLVPTYILITQYLHLQDTIWVYILPFIVSPWYVFMMRTFFQGIPISLSESMKIDGASEYRIFFQLILPLSKPVVATIALFTFLTKWNDWNTAMLYINDQRLISLQYLLQKQLREIQFIQRNMDIGVDVGVAQIPTTTVQMAMAMIVAGPAMLVFPFFQKYFTKGITIGAVKG